MTYNLGPSRAYRSQKLGLLAPETLDVLAYQGALLLGACLGTGP
jgi:hypothetical protein